MREFAVNNVTFGIASHSNLDFAQLHSMFSWPAEVIQCNYSRRMPRNSRTRIDLFQLCLSCRIKAGAREYQSVLLIIEFSVHVHFAGFSSCSRNNGPLERF